MTLFLSRLRRQNHPDGQIFTPPYLLNPDGTLAMRPNITNAPASAAPGAVIFAVTDSNVTAFSLIRVRFVSCIDAAPVDLHNTIEWRSSFGDRKVGAMTAQTMLRARATSTLARTSCDIFDEGTSIHTMVTTACYREGVPFPRAARLDHPLRGH